MTLSQTYISRKQLLVDNLVAQGVTGYTVNDGLTTLINAVLEIQGGGGTRTLTLVSDVDILSYADGDEAVLSATLLEDGVAVSGATVEFFNGSTSMGTAQTNSNGVATKTYTSTGAGDVTFTAEADNGSLSSETYSVCDAIKYSSDGTGLGGTYSTGSDGTYDYITNITSMLDPDCSLTTSCEITYQFKVTSSGGTGYGGLLWCIGSDADNGVLIGTEANTTRARIYSRSNGSNTVRQTSNNAYSMNTWFEVKITYQNGTISLTVGGNTISYSLSSVTYFKSYTSAVQYVQLSEFKVMPL